MAIDDTKGDRFLAILETAEHMRQGARRSTAAYPDASFEAQLLGQPGQKRGLRGGAPVLEAALGAYLSAEFAGPGDRRPTPGLLTIREI